MFDSNKKFFTAQLLAWSKIAQRPLPWKFIDHPFHILLSEFILQQTRVEQGIPYYKKFIETFPTVDDLAQAELDSVLKLWQGLGYYSRARYLHFAARQIVEKFNSRIPDNIKDLKSLKGIGDYTAAAIASFAYNKPVPVVDGNVYRVLSRYFGRTENFYNVKGKRVYHQLAEDVLAKNTPAIFNQALMDFGAMICTPQKPKCNTCPLATNCTAYLNQKVSDFPPPKQKIIRKVRHFHYLVISDERGNVLIKKRGKKDIWKGLFDFPMIEKKEKDAVYENEIKAFFQQESAPLLNETPRITTEKVVLKQILTHQKIISTFHHLEISMHADQPEPYILLNPKNLGKFAFPKTIDCYLKDNYLNLYIKNSYSW